MSTTTRKDLDSQKAEIVLEIITSMLEQCYTSMPGIIVDYDAKKQLATVKGGLKYVALERPEGYERAPVYKVPVIWPGTPRVAAHGRLVKDDPVYIFFSMRGIAKFVEDLYVESPATRGLMDEKDAFILASLHAEEREETDIADAEYAIQTKDGATSISMKEELISANIENGTQVLLQKLVATVVAGGTTIIANRDGDAIIDTGSSTISMKKNGDIELIGTPGNLTHNGVNVGDTHKHISSQPGTPTSTPQ